MPPVLAPAKIALHVGRERVSRQERSREPEPMVMNDEESVAAFHSADPILQLPAYRLNALALSGLLPDRGRLLDLGSGTGRLLAHLAEARPDVRLTGTDLAPNMLNLGREWLRDEGLDERVTLTEADMTKVPRDLGADVDAVSCVWALHHLPTEDHVRACLQEIARIRDDTGCAVWIFDFARYRRAQTFPVLMELSPHAPARLIEDGIASERAAWSADELRGWLAGSGLGDLAGGRERFLGWCQAYFAPGRNRRPGHANQWSARPLDRQAELNVALLRRGLPAFPRP